MQTNSPIWINSIPANGSFLIPQAGTSFEFFVQTGTIAVRASTSKKSGQYNVYPNGTGESGIEFDRLELKNMTGAPVTFALFVGSSTFINRGLPQTALIQSVSHPVLNAIGGGGQAYVDLPDLTGTKFQDQNGNDWLAIARQSILICNKGTDGFDGPNIAGLQYTERSGGENPIVSFIVPSGLAGIFNLQGDFTIAGVVFDSTNNPFDFSPMWGSISEIYQAIKPI